MCIRDRLAWDELTSRYELASGERVTDAMRVATVLAHAPEEVKTLLHTASRDIRRTYATLRQYIWEGVLSRVDHRKDGGGPVSMEVDAIQRTMARATTTRAKAKARTA